MILARIIGDVVSTHKIDDYVSLKMLIVQPIDPDGTERGKTFLAVDGVQAGVGDTVLVMIPTSLSATGAGNTLMVHRLGDPVGEAT